MAKIFIDGSAGTTGLRIYERLKNRPDIELIIPDDENRKEEAVIRECIKQSDITIMCLPDAAAKEAAAYPESENTIIIDTSTAHRVAEGWEYGFAELTGRRDRIKASKRVANPGCHASGFIALVAPLVEAGAIKNDVRLSAFSLTGYSGGGKKMIADYENPENKDALQAPRMYGIAQTHKHLPEMQKICGLEYAPVFCPIVSSYYAGMEVTVPLFAADAKATMQEIKDIYAGYYTGSVVKFRENADESGFMTAASLSGKDGMEITVVGNADRMLLVSRFDNLGKGASGAAVQNMNLVMGVDETTGLEL